MNNDKKTQLKKKVTPESFLRAFPVPQRGVMPEDQPEFQIVPARLSDTPRTTKRWRIVFSPVEKQPTEQMALELAGDVVLGSCTEGDLAADVNFNVWQGEERGVSQRHALLRPAREKLYILDLGSTNGTHHNGALLTSERVQVLQQGDLLTFGRLHLRVTKLALVEPTA